MHLYILVFALSLISVTFAQSKTGWDNGPPDFPGPRGKRGSLRGKPCASVMNCGTGWLYCIDGICQEKQAGRDCVGEGSIYTGGKSCCPPMAKPLQVNTPCKILSTAACVDDRDCSIRNGWEYSKCCPSYNDGEGMCVENWRKCN